MLLAAELTNLKPRDPIPAERGDLLKTPVILGGASNGRFKNVFVRTPIGITVVIKKKHPSPPSSQTLTNILLLTVC